MCPSPGAGGTAGQDHTGPPHSAQRGLRWSTAPCGLDGAPVRGAGGRGASSVGSASASSRRPSPGPRGGSRCRPHRSLLPPEEAVVSAVREFRPVQTPHFSRVFQEGLTGPGRRFGSLPQGALGPGWEDSQLLADQTGDPPTPHKAPSAHPQTEFAKCSSKAINTVQGEFPHLSLNKAHSGGLVYSQTAESVNDPEPRLPVTQMAVDKDLASCSKCQGCQWG